MPDAELEDMLAIPWEREGVMIDLLRSEGASETVQKAMLAVVRLSKSIEGELPESLREAVEQLGNLPPGGEVELSKEDPVVEDVQTVEVESGENAITVEKAKKETAIAHIKRRAKALGLSGTLLDSTVSKADTEGEETPDEEADEKNGNVTKEDNVTESYAVPVQKEDGTWDLSGVPDEAKPVWTSVFKSNEELGEQLKDARERISKQEDELRTREYIAKAETQFEVLAPATDLGPILKAAASGMDEETYNKLEDILKAAAERVRSGDLFQEKGKAALSDGSGTDAYSEAVRKANEMVEKSDSLTQDEAMARVFELHPELYTNYLVETAGGAG